MKRKDMKRSEWNCFLKKDYAVSPCSFHEMEGVVSLSVFREMTSPVVIPYEFGDVRIADQDYSWLQIAFKEQHVWMTAMYDACGNFVEIYFDITNGNYFDDMENPCFDDLYLDVVLLNNGELRRLDQEELEEAFQKREIGETEYETAITECEKLCGYLQKEWKELVAFCGAWRERLYHAL